MEKLEGCLSSAGRSGFEYLMDDLIAEIMRNGNNWMDKWFDGWKVRS